MHAVVYVPFALTPIAVALSRFATNRLPPRAAAWTISLAAVAVALSSVGALALLACPLPARIPMVAHLGRWQPHAVALRTPVPSPLSAVALAALAWLGLRLLRTLRGLRSELGELVAAHAQLTQHGSAAVIVVDDPTPRAHAIPPTVTHRGRVLVTTAMVDLLDDEERAAVVAHERAHLRHGHGAFLAVMHIAAGLDPLLTPLHRDLRHALERWADEDAARATDRAVMATALAKTALATLRDPAPASRPAWMSLHPHSITDRVTALLRQPPTRTRLAWALVATAALSTAALAWSTHDTEHFFEAVRTWSHP